MRSIMAVLAVLAGVGLVPGQTAKAQVVATASYERGPWFLLARDSEVVPVDVRKTPVLARRLNLDLAGATLKDALTEIESQSGLRLSYSDDAVPLEKRVHLRAEAITAAAALTDVLFDAGLDVVFKPDGSAALVKRPALPPTGSVVGRVTNTQSGDPIEGVEVFLQGTRWRTLTGTDGQYRLADVDTGTYVVTARRIGYTRQSRSVTVVEGQEATADFALQPAVTKLGEVVVTAEKREERLQDVPVPVTVVQADKLVQSNQLRLQDYYASIPGVSLVSNGIGDATLTIRGIATGGITNPTVGITVDDVPFGTPIGWANNTGAPNLDPGDLARIEVLRGPQGTLYGASSIGGLLKFVTVDPSTDRVSGRVQADLNGIHNGDAAGMAFRGVLNVPVSNNLAVRASGFRRSDPGYIDVPALHLRGVNDVDVYGARLSALWGPSATWSLKLSALLQNANADGTSEVNIEPGLRDLEQRRLLPTQGYDQKARSFAATVSGNLGSAQLVSLTGYGVDISNRLYDYSEGYYSELADLTFGVPGVEALWNAKTTKFTQEIRLSGSLLQRFDWLTGVFYSRDDNSGSFHFHAVDPTTSSPAGILHYDFFPSRFTEYAIFGNLTVHFTDRFDVQIGARGSHNRQRYEETLGGPLYESFGYSGELFNPPVHTKEDAFTYLVAPRFKPSPDLTIYARLASGYRPGGPNPTCILFGTPCQYAPDKTKNYELGVKGDLLNHRLAVDASIYRIDWRDIQLQIADPTTGFLLYTNASAAKSQGIELSAQARLLEGLTLGGWVAWNDGKLTRDLPPTGAIGSAGDRLPYSSPFSANVSVEQEFSLLSGMTAAIGGSMSYVGNRESSFAAAPEAPRLKLASYTQADVRAGIRHRLWSVNLYVNNVADERGQLAYNCDLPPRCGVNLIQPRSVGLSLVRDF